MFVISYLSLGYNNLILYMKIIRSSSVRAKVAPLPWIDFFERELYFEQDDDDAGLHIIHHAYISPPTESGPLFVMHHGAGSSGLSFAACTAEIRNIIPNAGVLSVDARHHGSTSIKRTRSENSEASNSNEEHPELNLTLETLSHDLIFIVNQLESKMKWNTLPDLVLVGHSLGGAVITDVVKRGDLGTKVLAYAVLDVVEGMVKY